MDLKSTLESSFILQNWQYFVIAFLVTILVNYYHKVNKNAATKQQSTAEQSKYFNEADDVIANFINDDADLPKADTEDTENAVQDAYMPVLEVKPHVPYQGATVMLPGGAQQFYEMVNNRRSVRSFRRYAPPVAVIEDCIRAAGTAPSGAHTEPWTFCLITEPTLKRQIREIVEAEEKLNYAQRMHRQWTADLRPLRTNYVKEYLTEAPYLVLVFKQTHGESLVEGGGRRQHYYHEISVAIATGVLLCAFQAAGLSSLVTTPLNCGLALRTLLARPSNEKLLVLLPVGYASEGCNVPDLKRKDLADILVKY